MTTPTDWYTPQRLNEAVAGTSQFSASIPDATPYDAQLHGVVADHIPYGYRFFDRGPQLHHDGHFTAYGIRFTRQQAVDNFCHDERFRDQVIWQLWCYDLRALYGSAREKSDLTDRIDLIRNLIEKAPA